MLRNIIDSLSKLFDRSLFLGIGLWVIIVIILLAILLPLKAWQPVNDILYGIRCILMFIVAILLIGFAGGIIVLLFSSITSFLWKHFWKLIIVIVIIILFCFKK